MSETFTEGSFGLRDIQTGIITQTKLLYCQPDDVVPPDGTQLVIYEDGTWLPYPIMTDDEIDTQIVAFAEAIIELVEKR